MPIVKEYQYYYIYPLSELLADFGGYIGLFVGLSVFQVLDFMAKMSDKNKTKWLIRHFLPQATPGTGQVSSPSGADDGEKEKLNGQGDIPMENVIEKPLDNADPPSKK